MTASTVFTHNRTQAVRLPAEVQFPEEVKKVVVRFAGRERIISPVGAVWDSFFLGGSNIPTDDFMNERASQDQPAREVERVPGLLSENGL